MTRRAFLSGIIASVLARPRATAAQPTGKVSRIAVLEPGPPTANGHLVAAFRQALRELGWEEGRNVVVETRFAEGNLERLPALARELAQLRADIFVVSGTPAIRAAHEAAPATPIIMSSVGDPVAEGFVASLRKPGGAITGVSVQSPELTAKRVQLLHEAVPRVSRLAIIWDPRIVHEVHGFKEAETAGRSFGMTLLSFEVTHPDALEAAFNGMARDGANGVFVFPNSITTTFGRRIADFAIKRRLPSVAGVRELAEAGALLAYGPDRKENYRRAAVFVHQVLNGARPGDLPIQQPTKFELIVNARTARALGVTIPQPLLLRADQVIE
jgi:putative ABC transport system substrate-binding protein